MVVCSLLGVTLGLGSSSISLAPAILSYCQPLWRLPSVSTPTLGSLPTDSIEAGTLRQGVARRRLAEPVDTFLQRVLPVSYTYFGQTLRAVQYSWRPSPFGKQLFFTAHDKEEYYRLYLFLADPFQANTYAVQRFELDLPVSDNPEALAIFFADVNRDGQKELLVLVNSSSREPMRKDNDGKPQYGHTSHYHTCIYSYKNPSCGGRPSYEEAASLPYLDGLKTAAEVRQALLNNQERRPQGHK